MKKVSKLCRVWLALVLLVPVVSCTEDVEIADLEGQWRFVHYYNLETKATTSAPADLSKSITLKFSPEGASGSITGHTLTNPVSGHFVLSTQSKISITTQDNEFLSEDNLSRLVRRGLQQADSYKVSQVSMNLYFHDSKEVLIFVRL